MAEVMLLIDFLPIRKKLIKHAIFEAIATVYITLYYHYKPFAIYTHSLFNFVIRR